MDGRDETDSQPRSRSSGSSASSPATHTFLEVKLGCGMVSGWSFRAAIQLNRLEGAQIAVTRQAACALSVYTK